MADEIVDSTCVLLPDLAVSSAGGSEVENTRGGKMTKDANRQSNWKIYVEGLSRVSPNKFNLLKGFMSEYGRESPCQPCVRSKIMTDDQQTDHIHQSVRTKKANGASYQGLAWFHYILTRDLSCRAFSQWYSCQQQWWVLCVYHT